MKARLKRSIGSFFATNNRFGENLLSPVKARYEPSYGSGSDLRTASL